MEFIADDATVSYSSSSTEEYPYPYPYPYQHRHRSVTKRRRTVRPRAHSLPISAASSAASAYDESSSTAATEEEDMAHCLILLARGRHSPPPPPPPPPPEKPSPAGAYECKTCNKCFSSFQALGGHRASHKKPKTAGPLEAHRAQQVVINVTNDTGEAATNNIENSKMKVHECSICGAEFSSGQALGGHMRRHRTVAAAPAPPESPETAKRGRNFLPLDLNLPPNPDEESMSPVALSFVERRPLAFSTAPALVDCYY